LLRDPQFDDVVALADPFGLSTLSVATKYWTAVERNTMLPPLSGVLLANRVLWSAVALALFAIAYRRFRFERRTARARGDAAIEPQLPRAQVATGPLPAPRADLG